jgi:hypothetical protein
MIFGSPVRAKPLAGHTRRVLSFIDGPEKAKISVSVFLGQFLYSSFSQ